MIKGLKEVQRECQKLDIEFHLLKGRVTRTYHVKSMFSDRVSIFVGSAKEALPSFMKKYDVGCLVTDMSPLRIPRKWAEEEVKEIMPERSCYYQARIFFSYPMNYCTLPLSQVEEKNIAVSAPAVNYLYIYFLLFCLRLMPTTLSPCGRPLQSRSTLPGPSGARSRSSWTSSSRLSLP